MSIIVLGNDFCGEGVEPVHDSMAMDVGRAKDELEDKGFHCALWERVGRSAATSFHVALEIRVDVLKHLQPECCFRHLRRMHSKEPPMQRAR